MIKYRAVISILALTLYALSTNVLGVSPTISTYEENGDRKTQYNLVIVADGYTATEQARFIAETKKVIVGMFDETPMKEYRKLFNIYTISTVSNQRGIAHTHWGVTKDNYFGTSSNGVYLYSSRPTEIYAAVAELLPEYKKIIVIANDSNFGGTTHAGICYISTHRHSPLIVKHELGHGIGGLGDEYVRNGANPINYLRKNITNNPQNIPWAHWIEETTQIPTPPPTTITTTNDINPVGLYEGANLAKTGWYRGHPCSKMNEITHPFGCVNAEGMILAIYRNIPLCSGFLPTENQNSSQKETKTFSIQNIKKPETPYKITWSVNSIIHPETTETLTLNSADLGDGTHTINVLIEDVSGIIRQDTYNVAKQSQSWTYVVTNQPPILTALPDLNITTEDFSHTFSGTGIQSITSSNPAVNVSLTNKTFSGTSAQSGTQTVTFTASNNFGTDTKTFIITIAPQIKTTKLEFTQLTPVNAPLEINGTGTLTATDLPFGLTINGTAVIGTPITTGTFNTLFSINSTYGIGTRIIPIKIAALPELIIKTPENLTVKENKPIHFWLESNNPTVQWETHNLPIGLSLNPTGEITGSIQTAGTYNFSIYAKTNQETKSKNCQIQVNTIPKLEIGEITPPQSKFGEQISLSLTANQPATFKILNNPEFSIVNGALQGTPSKTGNTKVQVEVATEDETQVVEIEINTRYEATAYQAIYNTDNHKGLITLVVQKTGAFSIVIPTEIKKERISGRLSTSGDFQKNDWKIQITGTNTQIQFQNKAYLLEKTINSLDTTNYIGAYTFAGESVFGYGSVLKSKIFLGNTCRNNKIVTICSQILENGKVLIANAPQNLQGELFLNKISALYVDNKLEATPCEKFTKTLTNIEKERYKTNLTNFPYHKTINFYSNGTVNGILKKENITYRLRGIILENSQTLQGHITTETPGEFLPYKSYTKTYQ
jgi:hypothetical protein